MQIVISISDSFYDRLIDMNSDSDTCSFNESALVESIQNGIPLPEKHGDLIDKSELQRCVWEADDKEIGEVDVVYASDIDAMRVLVKATED